MEVAYGLTLNLTAWNCSPTLCEIPEEWRPQRHRSRGLRARISPPPGNNIKTLKLHNEIIRYLKFTQSISISSISSSKWLVNAAESVLCEVRTKFLSITYFNFSLHVLVIPCEICGYNNSIVVCLGVLQFAPVNVIPPLFHIRLQGAFTRRINRGASKPSNKAMLFGCLWALDNKYFGNVLILQAINPLKPELNPICYLLALLGAHHFLHVSRIRVKLLTFRRLMS